MKIVLTGGAGFIGTNFCVEAAKYEHEVIVFDDFSTGYTENTAAHGMDVVRGTILDSDALHKVMEGADSCVHLAALGSVPRSIADPFSTHEVNARGTLNVLEAARAAEVGHVVVASSSSVYGMNPALPKGEREWVRPMSPYAVTKLATEQYALAYQQSFGLETLAFRFFNVYGPYQRAGHPYAAVVPTFVDALFRGDVLSINGDGSHSRDFTYVGTLCRVLLEAVERRISYPEPVNLAFGSSTNLLDLVGHLEEISGFDATVEHRDPRPGDVKHSQADNGLLRELFPSVVPTSIEAGLSSTLKWFGEDFHE
ncbi:NAD-dependent epimerase/dehydratase family protein [Dietzia cercidiphylli]|uniref:NAD-dependent epimerase/dehydratase family protein n=1 Tax=Dietzia cercidiphylli TaxID=498199 RepID=UPI00223BABFA|nr:NAD-dependent epimerase/dehydratase family protein [Dietzia cercidiphylli]MCT1516953.1 NAD-dependent epimerase/dehydratase family protein [Dietzia cercidiphylli]